LKTVFIVPANLPDVAAKRFPIQWLIACALSPFLLAVLSTDWLYDGPGYLDAFVYRGLFLFYDDPNFYAGNYKLGRLPWILTGYVMHKLFSVEVANFVLNFTFLCGSIAAFFYAVFRLFENTRIAILASIVLAFYSDFHGSAGWAYHNNPGNALYCLTAALLIRAALLQRSAALSLGGAGPVAFLMVLVNPTSVTFLPLFALLFVFLRRERLPLGRLTRELLRGALFAVVAAGAVFFVLQLINSSVGRGLDFYSPQLQFIRSMMGQNQWHRDIASGWMRNAWWLSIPAAVLISSLAASLLAGWGLAYRRRAIVVIVLNFVLSLMWILFEVTGQTALSPSYMFNPLLPSCFLALASTLYLFSRAGDRLPAPAICFAIGSAAMIISLMLVSPRPAIGYLTSYTGGSFAAGMMLAIAGFAAFAALSHQRALAHLATAAFIISVGMAGGTLSASYEPGYPCQLRRDAFLAITDLMQKARSVEPNFTKRRIWFPESTRVVLAQQSRIPLGTVELENGCQLNLTWLSYSVAVGSFILVTAYPVKPADQIPNSEVAGLLGSKLFVLTDDSADIEKLHARIRQYGSKLNPTESLQINRGPISFTVNVFSVTN
jgi:hypothetical protein